MWFSIGHSESLNSENTKKGSLLRGNHEVISVLERLRVGIYRLLAINASMIHLK